MVEFFETYRSKLFYALIVICVVILLFFLTTIFHKWLIRKEQKRFPESPPKTMNLVRRILNILWLILGVMVISFIFFGDLYDNFQHNFRLVLYLGLVSIVTILFANTINIWFRRSAERKLETNEDPTVLKFLRYVAVFFIYSTGTLFALLAFPSFKGVAQTALGGAGVIALIAGVASQEALANVVGGVFIITFKPFKIGDRIKVTDSMIGTVIDITLRHTVLRDFENKMIVIPNAIINKEKLVNFDLREMKICNRIEIGISYDSDVTLAKNIMQEECEKHPLIMDNRSPQDISEGKPKVRVALIAFGDSSVTIRAWAWARNYSNAFDMKCDLLESIKKRFENEGVEIALPYRTVVMKENSKRMD